MAERCGSCGAPHGAVAEGGLPPLASTSARPAGKATEEGDVDVVVVGAGYAGLAAARALQKTGAFSCRPGTETHLHAVR